jgi:hypothetical protein
MTDREILTAVLRWSTAYEARRAIGAEKRRNEKVLKEFGDQQFNPYAPTYNESCRVRTAASDASERLTPARRKELAALRELAKVCAKVRVQQRQVDDTSDVIDVDVKLLTC